MLMPKIPIASTILPGVGQGLPADFYGQQSGDKAGTSVEHKGDSTSANAD